MNSKKCFKKDFFEEMQAVRFENKKQMEQVFYFREFNEG